MKGREGQAVTFVDTRGVPHPALVTADWSGGAEFGSLNLVYVNPDPDQNDSYGQKMVRQSSVVNERNQSAHGNYWKV